ncbi:MAG: RHS repeat-associated core domain-containing protein, partial [Acutalibacteraceae bacterium]
RTHVANKNPYRYRGYYYDVETGLYYLKTRYYDPITCRFINADGLIGANKGIYEIYQYTVIV